MILNNIKKESWSFEMGFDSLGAKSNERKEQNIMLLRKLYSQQKVVTINSAMKYFGYSEKTILKWCKEGDIPLIYEGKPAVPFNAENIPSWWNNE